MGAAKAKPEQELITLDEAVEALKESWGLDDPPYKKSTIYNWISTRKIKRFGPHHRAMLDKAELLKKYGRNA